MTTTRWRDITHKPTCRDASRYEFLPPTDPQTDEEVVKKVYPDAKIARDHHSAYYAFTKMGAGGRISEYVGSEDIAWKSAHSKLPTDPQNREQATEHPKPRPDACYCCRESGCQLGCACESGAPVENREQAPESSKPFLSPEMASLVAGLREEAEYSEHYGGLVYVNNNNLILLLDALEGKSHE
jgi:hypothetical protein